MEESPNTDDQKEAEITNDAECHGTSEEKSDQNEKQDESNTGYIFEEKTNLGSSRLLAKALSRSPPMAALEMSAL